MKKLIATILISLIIITPVNAVTVLRASSVIFMRDMDTLFHAVCTLNCIEFDMLNNSGILDTGFNTDIEAAENYLWVRAQYYGTTFVPLPRVK